jgi:uncharacterized protein (DUF169 family)
MKEQKMITLELPPVGVKLLDEKMLEDFSNVTVFSGLSYCQAIFGATFSMELLIKPESIKTCKWVSISMGFKTPANDFERSINPHIEPFTKAVYVAPLHMFKKGYAPDAVILRTTPDNYRRIIDVLGWENFIDPEPYRQDITALNEYKMKPPKGFSAFAIKYVNKLLSALNRFAWWHNLTAVLFRSDFITKVFDKFITRYMANMSMCRNSFVIPYLTGKANISYFCTGGIAWGKNDPKNMTSGYPYEMFLKLSEKLDYPGKNKDDARLGELEALRKKLDEIPAGKGCTFSPVDPMTK